MKMMVYHGTDITLDIYEKIGTVVEMIAAQEYITFEEAYQRFAESRTYALLQNTNTLMWAESTEYIVDEYYRALGNECSWKVMKKF